MTVTDSQGDSSAPGRTRPAQQPTAPASGVPLPALQLAPKDPVGPRRRYRRTRVSWVRGFLRVHAGDVGLGLLALLTLYAVGVCLAG